MITKGQKINDRYQIIKTIGEGGMANVYLAYDTILNRNVAVKVLRGDLANDDKFVRRFQREALSSSSLSHPNIVEIFDVGEDDGSYYIVMEYVEGKTLKQLIKKRGSLTLTEVIDIMGQLTDGMSHAHESFIVHRDIKPQNIMILENGLIKITDFGIATAINATQLTQTNSVMGSVHYLPPEQANGKGTTVRSDIYSMGILMYELITGSIPFRGDNAVEIALKHLREPLPSIKRILPDIPQSIENIVLKSTAKNPLNRYKDAKEMHDDIVKCLSTEKLNEKKYIYAYPEFENDYRKQSNKQNSKQNMGQKKENVKVSVSENEKTISSKEIKKQNKTLVILMSVIASLVSVTAAVILLLPKLISSPNVLIPDVSNLSVVTAEKELEKVGFIVEEKVKEIASDIVEEDNVVKTSPAIGRTIKKGSKITLYVSIGEATFKLENYKDKNVIEIKAILEKVHNLNVLVEEKEVELADGEQIKENIIIDQSPKADIKVFKGDTVILYVAKKLIKYPDFTNGSYTVDDVKQFCKENKLLFNSVEEEKDDVEEGKIIKQSRPQGTVVQSGITFTITLSKAIVQDNNNKNNDE